VPQGLIHKGHELVGKFGHSTRSADASDIGTTADAAHPAAFSDIAIDQGAPAADFDQTLWRSIHGT
jgi:hypothetical protein